jgi:hypothetical protein
MTLFEITSLALALVALGLAWRARQRNAELQDRLARALKTLYDTRGNFRALREEYDTKFSSLDVALKKASGELRIEPSLRLSDLYMLEPRAQSVLAAFHIGGCDSCAVDDHATLAEAAQQTGANLDRVLAALNNLPPDGQALELRAPNAHFEM